MDSLFFELIQVALGTRNCLSMNPSGEEWLVLFEWCEKQAITGVVFSALVRLNEQGLKPPKKQLFEWIGLYEQLKGQNALMNTEASKLTKMLENEGHRTAILKGQANALLYPDPLSRQPGDVDIWVNGGMVRIEQTLRRLTLLEGELSKYHSDHVKRNYHHIHLPRNGNGIDVEVHFRPSCGNRDPFTNRRLQAFLKAEIDRDNELTESGFRIPSLKFALVMQLAHIQRHFLESGVGMRQVIDFFYLLKKCYIDGSEITEVVAPARLNRMGLKHISEALMWVLHEKLALEKKYLIAPIDKKRGELLLAVIMEGGNFGQYSQQRKKGFTIARSLKYRLMNYKFLKFDARETIWGELNYMASFVISIPERFRRRSWTLRRK